MAHQDTEGIASSSSQDVLSTAEILSLPSTSLNANILHASLLSLSDVEALTTCSSLISSGKIHTTSLARAVIDLGLARGGKHLQTIQAKVRGELGNSTEEWETIAQEDLRTAVETMTQGDQESIKILQCCSLLNTAKRCLDTFEVLYPDHPRRILPDNAERSALNGAEQVQATEYEIMDLDDPWAEAAEKIAAEVKPLEDPSVSEGPAESAGPSGQKESAFNTTSMEEAFEVSEPPIQLATFLSQPISASALSLAASASTAGVKIVCERYPGEVFPFRFILFEAMPDWVSPDELESVLPRIGADGKEQAWPSSDLESTKSFLDVLPEEYRTSVAVHLPARQQTLLDSEALSSWYTGRVFSLDALGMLDVQLAWIQHGASLGVPGLDELGEDLSLLSRLIYDSNLTPVQQENWNLNAWRQASVAEAVKAYLSNSNAVTIVADIRRLVMPYFYVLESRAERAGKPDLNLIDRLLHEAILNLPLNLASPVFEASKATLKTTDRLVKNDLNVARLALACLYGSGQREVWSTMSSIFECLPVWDVSGGDLEADQEATATTLDSIATFVRPSKAGAKPTTAHDLFIFFSPLPFASLSRALDILDVHLESGEILARWDTAVQLRFLLQSSRNTSDQVELAERMVRQQARRGPHTDSRWTSLWLDMQKLNGGNDALLRGAFGMLSVKEMTRIYLGGVLSSGHFDIAKRMIRVLEAEHGLSPLTLEEVALTTSRELYDNAETGNIHIGEMKLAYDCLSVATPSLAIRKEREFIEATSRLCSYNRSISPIEIRHSKDRLQLIRRILSSSDEAYRQAETILDLIDKLGYGGNTTARVEVLAMLADAAVQATDFERAFEQCQTMMDLAKTKAKRGEDRVKEVCWKTCLELGHQSEYADVGNKMTVLGWAVELCPPDRLPDILLVWRKVEDGQIRLGEAAKRRRLAGINQPSTLRSPNPAGDSRPSSRAQLREEEERVLGSRTAARAARLAKEFGERFNLRQLGPSASPLLGSEDERDDEGSERKRSSESERPITAMFDAAAEGERVRVQARRAIVKGVGWLLGADEKELAG